MALVLWAREKLAADAGVPDRQADGSLGGIVLAHNIRASEDVDASVRLAEAAGGTVTRAPAATSYGGYAACFADPDGHLWEVAHNPGLPLDADGALHLPDFGQEPKVSNTDVE